MSTTILTYPLVLLLVLFSLLNGVQSQIIGSVSVSDAPIPTGYGILFGLPDDTPPNVICYHEDATHSDVITLTASGTPSPPTLAGTGSTTCFLSGTLQYTCTPSGGTMTFEVSYTYYSGTTVVSDTADFTVSTTAPPCNAGSVGDPQFRGFRGQSYQIHGMDGVHYNLITSELTQVNTKFSFLNEGQCPIINGIPAMNCWSHPGSYMGALGIQRIVDGVNQQLMIEAGPAQQGFASVMFNNAQVNIGESSAIGSFSFNYTSSHLIIVETGNFTLMVDNSDGFVNQAVKVNIPLSKLTSHGLLGQTHSLKVYPTQFKYIEADVDDYAVSGLFENDFVFNQFSV